MGREATLYLTERGVRPEHPDRRVRSPIRPITPTSIFWS